MNISFILENEVNSFHHSQNAVCQIAVTAGSLQLGEKAPFFPPLQHFSWCHSNKVLNILNYKAGHKLRLSPCAWTIFRHRDGGFTLAFPVFISYIVFLEFYFSLRWWYGLVVFLSLVAVCLIIWWKDCKKLLRIALDE